MRGLKFVPLIVAAALLWFLFVSEQGSLWLSQNLKHTHSGPVVGRVITANGPFKRVHGGFVDHHEGPLSEPLTLHDGDRLETDLNTRVVVQLSSQDELELAPLTAVGFQLWNPADSGSPVYLQWLTGPDLKVLKAGVRGRTYLVRDGRLFLPGQKTQSKPITLTVPRPTAQGLEVAAPTADEVYEEPMPDKSPVETTDPETLSNEYIDETIASRQGQMQKCWLARLKDNPNLRGQMVLQIEISRRGKVKSVRVTDSTIEDELLKSCVTSVLERITFRPFRGSEISLEYPITFE